MPRPRSTVTLASSLAAVGLLGAWSTPAAAATRNCTPLKGPQKKSAAYRVHHSIVTSGKNPKTGEPIRRVSDERTTYYGVVSVEANTCRTRGRWAVVPPIKVDVASYGVGADGQPTGEKYLKGWGLAVGSLTAGRRSRVRVNTLYCKKDATFAGLDLLNSVPIPGLSYGVSAVKSIAGKVLPSDSTNCGDAGTSTLRLTASPTGRLRMRHTGRLKGEVDDTPYGGYGVTIKRHWDQPSRPRIR